MVFDKEQVLIIDDLYILGNNDRVFLDRMLENSNVINGTMSGFFTGGFLSFDARIFLRMATLMKARYEQCKSGSIDENYFSTLGIEILEGRNFSKDLATDREKIIVNKACADYYQFEDPLQGKLGKGNAKQRSYCV